MYESWSHAWFFRYVSFTTCKNIPQRPILPRFLHCTQEAIHLESTSRHVNNNLTEYVFWDMMRFVRDRLHPNYFVQQTSNKPYLKNQNLSSCCLCVGLRRNLTDHSKLWFCHHGMFFTTLHHGLSISPPLAMAVNGQGSNDDKLPHPTMVNLSVPKHHGNCTIVNNGSSTMANCGMFLFFTTLQHVLYVTRRN